MAVLGTPSVSLDKNKVMFNSVYWFYLERQNKEFFVIIIHREVSF